MMTRLWFEFAEERDAENVASALHAELPSVQRCINEPFAEHVLDQTDLADRVAKSNRGRQAITSSAEGLEQRWGPGVRLKLLLQDIECNILISRCWVRVTCDSQLPTEAKDMLARALRLLGEGELDIWESKSENGDKRN